MPTPGEEEVIQRLLTRFEFDQDSAEETAEATRRAEEQAKQITEGYRKLEESGLAASLDLKRQRQEEYFASVEAAVRDHYDRQLEFARGNADEERRITQQREEDLDRIQQRRGEAAEQMRDTERRFQGMTQSIRGGLGTLGLGGIAGLLSVGGLVGGVVNALEGMREQRVQAMKVAAQAGFGVEFAFPFTGRMREIARSRGVDPQQGLRLAQEFVPIAERGGAGAEMMTDLTRQALDLGAGAGVDPSTVARLFVQLRMLEMESIPNLREKFADIINVAGEVGVPAQKFSDWLLQATEQGRMYNISQFETTNLLGFFARELEAGTVTIAQITGLQRAVAGAPQGVQALIGEEVIRRGGSLGALFQKIGATSPHLAALAAKTIGEGGLIMETGEVRLPETEAERELANEQRRELQAIFRDLIDKYASRIEGAQTGFGAVWARQAVGQMLGMPQFGSVAAQELGYRAMGLDVGEREEMLRGRRGRGFLEPREVMTTAEELEEAGERLQRAGKSFNDRVKEFVTTALEGIGRGMDQITAALTGNWERYRLLQAEREAALAEAMRGGGGAPVGWEIFAGAFDDWLAGGPIGTTAIESIIEALRNNPVRVDVTVEDKAKGKGMRKYTTKGKGNTGKKPDFWTATYGEE